MPACDSVKARNAPTANKGIAVRCRRGFERLGVCGAFLEERVGDFSGGWSVEEKHYGSDRPSVLEYGSQVYPDGSLFRENAVAVVGL
jgi:hypothetical protein